MHGTNVRDFVKSYRGKAETRVQWQMGDVRMNAIWDGKTKKKKNPNGYTRYDGRYFILSKKPAKKTFVREALDHPSITFEKLISSPCILSSLSRLSVGGKWINFIQDPPYKYMIMYKVVDILMNNSTSRCATHVPSLYRDA